MKINEYSEAALDEIAKSIKSIDGGFEVDWERVSTALIHYLKLVKEAENEELVKLRKEMEHTRELLDKNSKIIEEIKVSLRKKGYNI